jgi:CheY-like chemotaxis protein
MNIQNAAWADRKIMVVDDDPDQRQMIKTWLEVYFDLSVIVATGGVSALSVAREHQPDMILMDVMMPQLNGIEATRRLKSEEALRHIPVVLYSSSPRQANWIEEAMAAGSSHCVDKMMSMQEMKTLIESVLSERAAEGSDHAAGAG